MGALLKRVWHDPVGSKVIAAAILFGGSRLVRYWPSGLLAGVNRWFDTPITITLTRADLVNWPLLAASTGIALYTIVLGTRIELRKRRAPPPVERRVDAQPPPPMERRTDAQASRPVEPQAGAQPLPPPPVEPQADAQPPETGDAKAPSAFEPEVFKLTPPRCRALLALLERVDCRNTLHELYQFVTKVGPFVDTETSKGQLQHDMEEAERVGIVSIDRVGALTQYYSLTAPRGRDWVLRNKANLQARAPLGMQRRDMRSPYG